MIHDLDKICVVGKRFVDQLSFAVLGLRNLSWQSATSTHSSSSTREKLAAGQVFCALQVDALVLICAVFMLAVREVLQRQEVLDGTYTVRRLPQPILERLFRHLLVRNAIGVLDELSCRVIVQVKRAFHSHRKGRSALKERLLVELRPELFPVGLLYAAVSAWMSLARAICSRTILLYDNYVVHR